MPPTNSNDPLLTTNPDPRAAIPGSDHTADFAPGSSGVDGGAVAHVPGQATKPMVAPLDTGMQWQATLSVPGQSTEPEEAPPARRPESAAEFDRLRKASTDKIHYA